MTSSRELAEIDVVTRRVELLEYLTDVTARKSELVAALDTSRSTIDRAIGRLEAAGFVERQHAGYTTTQPGRLAAARYRRFVDEQRSILNATDVLAGVPRDAEVPIELLLDARVETEEPADRLFELFADRLASADRCRAIVPAIPDSRQLRLCHAETVRGDLDAELLVDPDVLSRLRTEFPRLSTELVDHGDVDVLQSTGLSFGLFLFDHETNESDSRRSDPSESAADGNDSGGNGAAEGRSNATVVLVTYEDAAVRGYVVAEHDEALRWARTHYEQLRAGASDRSDRLHDARSTETFSRLTGDRLPAQLREEGFVRVDEAFLDRREPVEPTTAWRAGIGLPEVAAGYAVPRLAVDEPSAADPAADGPSTDDEPTVAGPTSAELPSGAPAAGDRAASLADELLSSLATGTDHALVGPPGSGKSTVAKRVAYAWHDREYGQVFYRESGMGQPIGSVALLEDVLDRTPEPALVVVEDAVSPDANAIFETMHRLSGRDDVVFLLDARERDWTDPAEFPTDARLRAYRQEAVETVTLSRIDREDCRRLIEHVESILEEPVEVAVDTLLADVGDTTVEQDGAPPGSMLLLFDRLARTIEPLSAEDGGETPTVLDEAVDRLRDDLAAMGEPALDVGVLVNVLNAADLGVYPAYVHAITVATDGSGSNQRERLSTVRAALDRLDGHVIFRSDDDRPPHRAIHGTWSLRFLERLLEDDARTARARFGRCVTALLALADEPERRARLRTPANVDDTALAAIEERSGEWADETLASVLDLGEQNARLAPLFGTADAPSIELPSACSTELALQQLERIGRTRLSASDSELAHQAFEQLERTARELDTLAADRYRIESLLGRSRLARRRGAYDDARDVLEEALELATDHSDRRLEARCRFQLGVLARNTERFDAAVERFERCRETFRDLGDPKREADVLRRLGEVRAMCADLTYGQPGALATAIDELEASLECYRSLGDRRGEADARRWLGQVKAIHPDRSAGMARQEHRAVVELARQLGDRDREARALYALGDSWAATEEFSRARTHFGRALELFDDGDRTAWTVVVRRRLGVIDVLDGEFDRARERLETALADVRSIDRPTQESRVLRALAELHVYCCELETAEEHARSSLELAEELEDGTRVVRACQSLGRAQLLAGDLEAARRTATRMRAAERAYDVDEATPYLLAPLAFLRGDHAAARDHAQRGLDGPEPEGIYAIVLGRVALAAGILEDAVRHFTDAIEEEYYDEHRYWAQHALIDRARARRRRDSLDAAAADLDEAVDRARNRQYPLQEVRVSLQRGAIARARGEFDRATERLDRAVDRCRELGTPLYQARARFERGLVARESGELATAREDFVAAATRLREIGTRGEEARVLEALVDVCTRLEGADAADHRRRHERLTDELTTAEPALFDSDSGS